MKQDKMRSSIYDVRKSYLENLELGPFFNEDIPIRVMPPEDRWIDFLGFRLASPIGIPAGPLLDSKWIRFASAMGFDLLTYKTIRSHAHPAHPLPNILPVWAPGPLDPNHLPDHLGPAMQEYTPEDDRIGITNSFGNPSQSPDFLRMDLPKAKSYLLPGQAMIVSVFGSTHQGKDILQDFVEAAILAKECGASLIEANYSCPNVAAPFGSVFACPDRVYALSAALVQAIGDTPLIIKVGAHTCQDTLRDSLISAAKAGVRAVCGLNTISMQVLDETGKPLLGPSRPSSGICGNPIRQAALEFTARARLIIDKEKLGLKLLSTGGMTQPDHFQLFLDAGADIAMSATGMMWDPFLALKYHQQHTEKTDA